MKLIIFATIMSSVCKYLFHRMAISMTGITCLVFILSSCSSTKHVPEDEYLLNKYKSKIDNRELDRKELDSYVRPKPNRRMLGLKFYLGLYNLSGKKDNGLNRWLKKIGEEPVLWNEYEVDKNRERLDLYLRNKGFYYAQVKDSTRFSKQKAVVHYSVISGEPYIISKINYHFLDTTLKRLILGDTAESVIKEGSLFDMDLLQEERSRIEAYLKHYGYYNFNQEYIQFQADSTRSTMQVEISAVFNEYQFKDEVGYYRQVPHRKYEINNVYVFPDFDQKQALLSFEEYRDQLETLEYKEFEFYFQDKLKANPKVISQSIYILPGQLYSIDDVAQSYKHLASLHIFKLVNIQFVEVDPYDAVERDVYPIDCYIQLSPSNLQSYTVELEGTNSSGNIGVAGNLSYLHRNLFGGAEALNFRIKGALESIKKIDDGGFDKMVELGAEAKITVPQFLLPLKTENFIRKYNPKTNISIAYNYQNRPDYERSLAKTALGYDWQATRTMFHIMHPFELNYVNMINRSDAVWDQIRDTYLRHSYEDRLIIATTYSFIYNNQDINKLRDYIYIRTNIEQAGNLISGVNTAIGEADEEGYFSLFGNQYAQYIKGDVDLRYYHMLESKTSLIFRFFTGAAYPYGNAIAIPFEKQYYS
ncbi:MAG: BamA/TamA family outer membrane protein, partial [Bacteroidales bacterium]|nr:BamA/TamA family outer membrane protein [Bacteroidales bacterium]